MKVHSQEFKDTIASLGRQQDVIITYTIDNEEITLTSEDINSATPVYEANLLKSVMKELELDSNIDIPLDTQINFKYGIYIESTGQYEYLDFGNYIVYSSEKQEDQYSYRIKCYDKMLYSMVEYEAMNITYPITIREYLGAICTHLGITFANSSDVFANYNKEIPYELYIGASGADLGYTFRDVLTEIAQATGSVICINSNDELEVRYPVETNDTIDEEYLKDTDVSFKEKYGPINSIVLSRSAESDNVYLRDEQSVTDNGLCEVKIADNQIMNFNDRSDYLQGILASIGGIEYYTCDYTSTGICYYDLLDYYTVTVGEQNYKCLMLNDEIDITQGLEEHIHAEMPEETKTDYEKADKTDRRINQAYIMVDKQNQKIEALAEQITDLSIGGESNTASITLTNIGMSEPIYINIHPIDDNISYLYPRENLYPSDILYLPTRNIVFASDNYETTYTLPDDLLYYNATTYDEFILDRQNNVCKVIKRCAYNADGTVSALAQEIETTYDYPSIILEDGNYTVSIENYSKGYINVSLLGQGVLTTQYVLKSVFEQTANGISTEVSRKVGEDELGTKIQQDYESVQIAWNRISEYIKFEDGKLNIYDEDNNLLMSLDKNGQHFYNESVEKIGDIGTITYPVPTEEGTTNVPMIAFNLNVTDEEEPKGMAWGIQKGNSFYPVFYMVGAYAPEQSEYGGLFYGAGTFILGEAEIDYLNCDDGVFNLINSKTIQVNGKNVSAIDSSNLNATNGYIRYTNGFQIAWKSASVTAGGNSWGNLYYSDHSMGNWAASFKTIYNAVPSISATQYWCSAGSYSATSAGTVRAMRPTSGTSSVNVRIIGYGVWK